MIEKFGWNANNMFFLTRDGDIVLTSWQELTFRYASQWLPDDAYLHEELDEFGRYYIDKRFIHVCQLVSVYAMDEDLFKSFSCKKTENGYIVRLEYGDEELEMELFEMSLLLPKRLNHDTCVLY